MTLHDLWLIILRYYKAVILVPVLCALLAASGMGLLGVVKGSSYTVTSKLTVTDPTGLVGSTSLANLINVFAEDEAESVRSNEVDVEVEPDAASQSVEFTVKAATTDQAIALANSLAEQTKDTVQAALLDQGDAFLEAVSEIETSPLVEGGTYVASGVTAADRAAALRSCSYTISGATPPSESGASGLLKYAIVGFGGGLFLTICVLVLMDSIRRPIKGGNDLAKITNVPVLSEGNTAKSAERLWINLCFVANDEPLKSVCVLPVSGEARMDIGSMLQTAVKTALDDSTPQAGDRNAEIPSDRMLVSSVDIIECDSIRDNMAGAKVARGADATVLVVHPWTDKAADVAGVLDELKLAKAYVAGIVLA